jgi:hypothetical protein
MLDHQCLQSPNHDIWQRPSLIGKLMRFTNPTMQTYFAPSVNQTPRHDQPPTLRRSDCGPHYASVYTYVLQWSMSRTQFAQFTTRILFRGMHGWINEVQGMLFTRSIKTGIEAFDTTSLLELPQQHKYTSCFLPVCGAVELMISNIN